MVVREFLARGHVLQHGGQDSNSSSMCARSASSVNGFISVQRSQTLPSNSARRRSQPLRPSDVCAAPSPPRSTRRHEGVREALAESTQCRGLRRHRQFPAVATLDQGGEDLSQAPTCGPRVLPRAMFGLDGRQPRAQHPLRAFKGAFAGVPPIEVVGVVPEVFGVLGERQKLSAWRA